MVEDEITIQTIDKLLEIYNTNDEHVTKQNALFPKGHRQIRRQNFLPEISENIAKFAIFKKYNKMPNWNTKNGDLSLGDKQLEVKAYSSGGPISFGPKERWEKLYIVDALDHQNKNFRVYEINLSNDDPEWENIQVKKNQTYQEQCDAKRRPRITMDALEPQIGQHLELIFDGNISELY